jgi:hypothetical protein
VLPLLFDIYPIIPDDDPASLDIVILVSHRSSCDLAVLCQTSQGYIWLSGRDVKNTWPKTYAAYARWHVKETGVSPISFLRKSDSSPDEVSLPVVPNQQSYADVSKGKHLADVQFHYENTLASFTHAVCHNKLSLIMKEWKIFWSSDSRSSSPLADFVQIIFIE